MVGCWGSLIGLAWCGIRHFFAVIFRIWAQNWGGKLELILQAGARFRVFMGLRFTKGIEWDTRFQTLFSRASETLEFVLPVFSSTLLSLIMHNRPSERDLTPKLISAKTASWQKQTYSRIAVWAGMPSFGKKKFWAQISRNVKTLKALK